MTLYVVCERERAQQVLERLIVSFLGPGSESFRVVRAGGRSAAVSLARTLLATRDAPVVLLLDAHTVDPSALLDQKKELQGLLDQMSGQNQGLPVLLEPEIESVFFEFEGFFEGLGLRLRLDKSTNVKFSKDVFDHILEYHRFKFDEILQYFDLFMRKNDLVPCFFEKIIDFSCVEVRRAVALQDFELSSYGAVHYREEQHGESLQEGQAGSC